MAQMMGTLEAELATPAPPWMVLGSPPMYEFGAAAPPVGGLPGRRGVPAGIGPESRELVFGRARRAAGGRRFSGLGLLAAGTTMLVRRLNPVALIHRVAVLLPVGRGCIRCRSCPPGCGRSGGCCRSRMRWRCSAARCWSAPDRPRWRIPFAGVAHFRRACWRPSGSACSRSRSGARGSTARSRTIEPETPRIGRGLDLGVAVGQSQLQ